MYLYLYFLQVISGPISIGVETVMMFHVEALAFNASVDFAELTWPLVLFFCSSGLEGGAGEAGSRLRQAGPFDIIRCDIGREPLHLPLWH